MTKNGILRWLNAPNCGPLLCLLALYGPAGHSNYNLPDPMASTYMASCPKALQPGDLRMGVLNSHAPNAATLELNRALNMEVIGQVQGVRALVNAVEIASAGIQDPKKPFSRNLFTGPTGVGKTETLKAFVRSLGGDPDFHLIRVDCGEFQEGHKISQLIGASASYVGYGDRPKFDPDELKKRLLPIKMASGETRMINVFLFDEIEKCHDDVFRLLLSILDEGKVTLGDLKQSFFRDGMINATSNLGAREAEALIEAKSHSLANIDHTHASAEQLDLTGRFDQALMHAFSGAYENAIMRRFAPEFRNRWSAIIQYQHLGQAEHFAILQKQLARIQMAIFQSGFKKVGLLVSESARMKLVREGTNVKDGARPMENLLIVSARQPLARLMTTGQVRDGDILLADLPDGAQEFSWQVVAQGLTRGELEEFATHAYPGYGFENFVWEAKPAEIKAEDLLTILNRDQSKVIKDLYSKILVDSAQARQNIGSQSVTISLKYMKIGERLVRLVMDQQGHFSVTVESEIIAALRPNYEGKLTTMTEEEVRALIATKERKP